MIRITPKGEALLVAMECGLVKERFGKINVTAFSNFWDRVEPLLSKDVNVDENTLWANNQPIEWIGERANNTVIHETIGGCGEAVDYTEFSDEVHYMRKQIEGNRLSCMINRAAIILLAVSQIAMLAFVLWKV